MLDSYNDADTVMMAFSYKADEMIWSENITAIYHLIQKNMLSEHWEFFLRFVLVLKLMNLMGIWR